MLGQSSRGRLTLPEMSFPLLIPVTFLSFQSPIWKQLPPPASLLSSLSPLSYVLLSSSLQVICTLVAAFLHFFFLSSFCWVLTEAWQSYMAVTGRLRNRIIRKRFLCLGWGEDCGSA